MSAHAVIVPERCSSFAVTSGSLEALKWLAVVAMVVDHVNAVFFARELGTLAAAVGRVAFPLFALVIGYNLARPGVDLSRVLRRVALFALLAFPFHALLFGQRGGWWPANVLVSFSVAVAVLWCLDQADRGRPEFTFFAAALFTLGGGLVEFLWPGVALVIVTAVGCRKGWTPLRVVVLVAALVAVCGVNGNAWALLALPVAGLVAMLPLQVPRLRWAFYAVYPLHLAMLAWWA